MWPELDLPPRTRIAPKYKKIAENLRLRIYQGKLTGMLPGVRLLAEEYEVTLMTANKALNLLVKDNIVYRVPNKGTFVSESAPVKINTIAVIVNDLNLPLTSRAVRSMGMVATEFGKQLLFFQHFGDIKRETEIAHELLEKRTSDGVVLMPSINDPGLPALDVLTKAKFPAVVFSRRQNADWNRFHTIHSDHGRGFEKGTNYLISLGHHQIGLIFPEREEDTLLASEEYGQNERWQGYARAMQGAGLEARPPIFLGADHPRNPKVATELMSRIKANTAVFAFCDSTATTLLTILHQAGIRVPNDLSLLSYDGAPFTERLNLTTISQPMERMARRAIEVLLTYDSKQVPTESVYEGELIERSSCRKQKNSIRAKQKLKLR